jgi:two-component system response regulator LytT
LFYPISMMKMKVLIIEDESYAVKHLRSLLLEISSDIVVIGEAGSIKTTTQWLEQNQAPDLIFMDIHLADGSSFEIFNRTDIRIPVVFTTAYDEYAIDAFRVNGLDYLLKPIKRTELVRSINRFRNIQLEIPERYYEGLSKEISKQKYTYQKRFLIKYGLKYIRIEIKEIAYFYAEDKETYLCTFDNRRLPLDQNLDKLLETLDPAEFFRANRKIILHINAISSMMNYSRSRIKIILQPEFHQEVIVSTDKTPGFKYWITGSPASDQE